MSRYDFVIVGAGCFGAWTAHELVRRGLRVLLVDAYGPAHARASSGGESRLIRMGYGPDELYTRWSRYSLQRWKALAERVNLPLWHPTGMLWLAGANHEYIDRTQRTLHELGVAHAHLSREELQRRFPQIGLDDVEWALWEPDSGALMARQSIQALVADALANGLEYRTARVQPPPCTKRLACITTESDESIAAGCFVFACGAWLPRVFPDLLGRRIFPSRQEIFFFSPPPGDTGFGPESMPAWFDFDALVYGAADLENRGFKLSIDRHGPPIDPDDSDRLPSADLLATARQYLARRFPRLRHAPLNESRVCQYENTSNGDFIIDRHPHIDNVFIVGGGSGHGFKHGPAVGDYASRLMLSEVEPEPRFGLSNKQTVQHRDVF